MYISRKLLTLSALWSATELCLATDTVSFPRQEGVKHIENQFIIEYRRTTEGDNAKETIVNNPDKSIVLVKEIPSRNIQVVNFASNETATNWLSGAENGVKFFDQDSWNFPDTQLNTGSHNRNLTESIPYGITYVNALDVSDDNAGERKVCIIDSGYDMGHPDLPSDRSLFTGESFINNKEWDTDENGAGTLIAGVIVALQDNEIGVVGVIRNGQLKMHISKVFDGFFGGAPTSRIIEGFQSCVANGSNVINMSLSGSGYSPAFASAIQDAEADGILILAASGGTIGGSVKYPAAYPNVISVAAITEDYVRYEYSAYNDKVDISAPGVNILSTIPGGGYSSYGTGTSMACPHAAGVAALVWSHYPSMTNKVLRDILDDTASDLGTPGYDVYYGHGLIDASAAFAAASNIFVPTVSPGPSGTSSTSAPTLPCRNLEIDILTDRYGSETSWELTDPNGEILFYDDLTKNRYEYNYIYCLPPKCDYTFTIYDSFGEGICCDCGQGSYSVTYGGVLVISGGDFGSQESTTFGCDDECADSTSNFALEGGVLGCPYVAENPEKCEINAPINVKSHCPNTCFACAEYGCEDSEAEFTVERPTGGTVDIYCNIIPGDKVEIACAEPTIFSTCRKTCSYCDA